MAELRQNTWLLDDWYAQAVAGNAGYIGNNELWGAGWNYKGMLGQNSIRPAPSGGYSSPIQIPGTLWSQKFYQQNINDTEIHLSIQSTLTPSQL